MSLLSEKHERVLLGEDMILFGFFLVVLVDVDDFADSVLLSQVVGCVFLQLARRRYCENNVDKRKEGGSKTREMMEFFREIINYLSPLLVRVIK